MSNDRLPKSLCGDFPEGKHPVDRTKLRYKDVIKIYLKDYGIDPLHGQIVIEDGSTRQARPIGSSAVDIKAYRINQEITCARRHAGNLTV